MLFIKETIIDFLEENYPNQGISYRFKTDMPDGEYTYIFSPDVDISPFLTTTKTGIRILTTIKIGDGVFIVEPRSQIGDNAQPYRYIISKNHPQLKSIIEFVQLNSNLIMMRK